jgi:hypothetical protein
MDMHLVKRFDEKNASRRRIVAKRKSFESELIGYKVTDKRDKALINYITRKKK